MIESDLSGSSPRPQRQKNQSTGREENRGRFGNRRPRRLCEIRVDESFRDQMKRVAYTNVRSLKGAVLRQYRIRAESLMQAW
jgi:hypothetical protein